MSLGSGIGSMAMARVHGGTATLCAVRCGAPQEPGTKKVGAKGKGLNGRKL